MFTLLAIVFDVRCSALSSASACISQ